MGISNSIYQVDITEAIYRSDEKMMTGQLKFIVLKALCEHKESGYSLMKHIEENTGCWKPSAGSMYPLLEGLLKKGCVTVEKKGRKKIYTITGGGREVFLSLATKRGEFVDKMIEGLNVLTSFYDQKDMGYYAEMLLQLKTGEMPYAELSPELNQFRSLLFEIHKQGKVAENKPRMKAIIRKAVEDLRKLK